MFLKEELARLKRGLESERVELKPSIAQSSPIRRAICAFANGLAGRGETGVVFVGLKDDGSCAALDVTDEVLGRLSEWALGGDILPRPDVEVYRSEIESCPVAVVEVRPCSRPPDFDPPAGEMEPRGYVVVRHSVRLDRPVKAFEKWMSRIPGTYRKALLGTEPEPNMSVGSDPHCLATLGNCGSLMLMAREARKPMFHLKPADGAIGSHVNGVSRCYRDFNRLAEKIAKSCGLAMPE